MKSNANVITSITDNIAIGFFKKLEILWIML